MKDMELNINILKLNLFILFALLLLPGFVFASSNEKVIVVSHFKIESQEKLDFLEKGIERMLETRLKIPGHASVVFSPGELELNSVKADYILTGTVLVFGNSVSTDATLANADSGEVELTFSQFGKEKGEVLSHIDLFAERIRTEILNLAPARRFRQSRGAETGYESGSAYVESQKPVIWRSRPFDYEIRSIAVADIDNDSKNETIILSKDRIQVFRRISNKFEKLSEVKVKSSDLRLLFVDVIDINNDGVTEIFITGVNDATLRPDSSLYKWTKSGLMKVRDHLSWIFRAVDTKSKGRILLGQATKGDDSRRLETGIYRMVMDESGKLSTGELSFPFADTPLGLAFGDFLNNGRESIAMLDLKGKISIYSFEGAKIFKSPEKYGGSKSYIEFKGMRYNQDDGYQKERIYLQQRVFAADLSQSGKTSLITVRNNDSTKGVLAKVRQYDKGHIESLLSNEMGIMTEGRTQRISGYISDYTIADMDNDGTNEIVFANVSSEGLLKKKKSRIVSQSFIVKGVRDSF